MIDNQTIHKITNGLMQSYIREGGINHLHGPNLPSQDVIIEIIRNIETLLFPGFYRNEHVTHANLEYITGNKIIEVIEHLTSEVHKNLEFDSREHGNGKVETELYQQASEIVEYFLMTLPQLRDVISSDVTALLEGDPAARSEEEIILSYPGLIGIAVHRVAHFFWTHGVRLIARMMSEYIHSKTGIDIHPGASIGKYFYIDHGTGVVIGETTVIGDHVKIYQGVSLGALSVSKKLTETKRHPTIEDDVTIYAGATILGGETVIGHHSIIGGNVWLVRSIPPYSLVENDTRIKLIPKNNMKKEWYYEI